MSLDRWLFVVPLRLRSIFRRSGVDRELEEELNDHVERLTAQYIARGMPEQEARRDALIAIGGVTRRREEMRDARGVRFLDNLLRDIALAARSLRRTPGFTAVNVLTLALGIGANTAIFTVVNAVLLRPLDYGGDPSRLVFVQSKRMESTAPAYVFRWKESATRVFDRIGAASFWTPTLAGERPEQIPALRVSPDVFQMLEVRPLLGRLFLPTEEHDASSRVAMLSYPFWRDHFASDSGAVGRRVQLDGVSHTVIGVMPPSFRFAPFWATDSRVWTPLVVDGLENDRQGASLRVFAKLRPGVSLEQANSEMAAIGAREKATVPEADADLTVIPLREKTVGDVRDAMWILFAAVTVVLLIACANVAHLQLMRAAAHERETALRLCLGASRWRIAQQALVTSGMLALAGGVLGLATGALGVRMLTTLAPRGIPRVDTIAIDLSVFGFLLLVAVVAGLGAGAAPALLAARARGPLALQEGARGASDSRRRRRISGALVVSEFAMAVVLLVGAGLVLRSFAALLRVDPGFDADRVMSMQVSTRGTVHDSSSRRAGFYAELIARIGRVPDVEAVSAINHLPLHGDDWHFPFVIEGRPAAAPGTGPLAVFRVVQPAFFRTLRMTLVAGRDFTQRDVTGRGRVVVVDESFARTHWPGEDAIGRRLSVDHPSKGADWFTVVGIVRDARQTRWTLTEPAMYFPFFPGSDSTRAMTLASMLTPSYMTLVIRTGNDPAAIVDAVRRIVHDVDMAAPVSDVITLDAAIDEQLATPRFYLLLLGGFAAVALALAAIGVYGVVSYGATRRTREIGIRLALGAQRRDPFWLVVRGGLRLAFVGIAGGAVGALMLSHYLRSLLYGVEATDPVTFLAVVGVLLVTAAVACAIPASRAARLDPVLVLRAD